MATKIVTKNSSTASAVPTASDLVQGELAVNVADKRLFTEDNAGAIVELGTKPSTIDINAGTIDGTTIGASSASTGAFTTLTATGAFTSRGIDDNADATAITIDSSENVGIGTSSPTRNLSVAGAFGVQSTANDGAILMIPLGTENRIYSRAGEVGGAGTALPLAFRMADTEVMRIDSSGNVGIGVVPKTWYSASTALEIGSMSLEDYDVSGANVSVFANNLYRNTSNAYVYKESDFAASYSQYNGEHTFNTAPSGTADSVATLTPVLKIDASGNVGIGTSSPSASKFSSTPDGVLNVSGDKPVVYLTEEDETDSNVWMGLSNEVGIIGNTGTALAFRTGASTATESARIDSSGNLLVGQTVGEVIGVGNTTEGISLGANGRIFASYNGQSAYLNRNGTDGALLGFYRAGTAVGSIGTNAATMYVSAPQAGGMKYSYLTSTNAVMLPVTTTGANADGLHDLGLSNARFRDLYLSSGVYLGGTGAANKLDDYEEGTFSGTSAGSVYTGTYTKVGRICHISITIDNTNSTGTQLASLPFSSKNGGTSFNGSQPTFNSSSTEAGFFVAPYNGGTALFGYNRVGATLNISSGSIAANFTYETD